MLCAILLTCLSFKADTAFYYNDSTHLIRVEPDSATSRNNTYVIRTPLTSREVYPCNSRGIPSPEDPTTCDTSYRATVQWIPQTLARRVEALIRGGQLSDPLVRKNLVQILNMKDLVRIRDLILDKGQAGDAQNNNREYFGIIRKNGTISDSVGPFFVPRKGIYQEAVFPPEWGDGIDYHSHPSGTKQKGDSLTYTVQGISNLDQTHAKPHGKWANLSYEFGMSAGRVYVFDKDGIWAVLDMHLLRVPSPAEIKQVLSAR